MTTPTSTQPGRTRAALLTAGLGLYAARPVDAVSIDEIVRTAGVGKGSFFNHFTDRPAFAAALGEGVREDVAARLSRFNEGVSEPLERLVNAMMIGAVVALREPDLVRVLWRTVDVTMLEYDPLHDSVSNDMRQVPSTSRLLKAARERRVLFWLGCCRTVMTAIVAEKPDAHDATGLLHSMAHLGLLGLGVAADEVEGLATLHDLSAW